MSEKESKDRKKESRKKHNRHQSYHWADRFAEQIIKIKGDKDKYVMAAGITPSGTIHMGNFREVITADLIKRALEDKKKKVRFIYSWDDNDVLRKVPKNLPQQEKIKKELRKPVFAVFDPFGCHKSYAEHFEKEMEEDIPKVGIDPEYLYQHKEYQACKYAEGIKIALEKKDKIIEILNQFRKEPLANDWMPIFVFCDKCHKDTLTKLKWEGDYDISYQCECGQEETFDFRKKGLVTLRWRIDWPYRWSFYKEDFESAGKDHFAAGGSVTTARMIQKEIYGTEPPFGFCYEWIGIKGKGEFASSLGNVITLKEALEIYEPEIVRYLFASTRPNMRFNISFDVDVLKVYEEYNRCERIYFGVDKTAEKETAKQKRIYELSNFKEIPKTMPYQPSFRHLTTILQINEMDVEKAVGYFAKELKNPFDKDRLKVRAGCVKNWLEKYAPEDFKFSVQEKFTGKLKEKERKVLKLLGEKLKEKDWTDVELHEEMYILCQNEELESKEFFKSAYQVLVGKDKGPRLASFILEIGKERVAELLEKV